MWNDEACVFESIQYFEPRQMFTTPLRALQVFPRVYLFLIQQFSGLFNFHLLSLRFFFVRRDADRVLALVETGATAPESRLGLLDVSFLLGGVGAAGLLRAELKPYSMDVLAGAIFMTFLYHEDGLRARDARKYPVCPRGPARVGAFFLPGVFVYAHRFV